jgi:hypothetical protein
MEDDVEVECLNGPHIRPAPECDPTFGAPTGEPMRLLMGDDALSFLMQSNGNLAGLPLPPQVPATPEAEYIVEHLLMQWLDLFLEKNRKYAKVNTTAHLGPRGHYPNVHRKVGVLRDRVWEGNESPGEPTKEVIFDLIGHLFLMAADLDKEDSDGV